MFTKRLGALIASAILSSSQAKTPPRPISPEPKPLMHMEESQIVYQILTAEIALDTKYSDLAFNVYLKLAKHLQKAELAERALEIALAHNKLFKATHATRLWARLAPNNANAQAISAILLIKTNALTKASLHLQALIAQDPKSPGLFIKIINELTPGEELSRLDKIMQPLFDNQGDPALYHFLKAFIAKTQHQLREAINEITTALQLRPDWPEAIALYGELIETK